jgi:hypothetical protein
MPKDAISTTQTSTRRPITSATHHASKQTRRARHIEDAPAATDAPPAAQHRIQFPDARTDA